MTSLNVELWLEIGDVLKPVLSIPNDLCRHFSLHPLKWLRYLGYIIYGREGHLSSAIGGPEVDYASEHILLERYYFSSSKEALFIDAKAIDGRTTDSYTSFSSNRAIFRNAVNDRDSSCIFSALEADLCVAAHILPHAKGDDYIKHITSTRGKDDEDRIESINDPRNGLLLNPTSRSAMDRGYFAFLQTPNFALSEDDIPPSPWPVDTGGSSDRFTLQYFSPLTATSRVMVPHNQDARKPVDVSEWPPAVITDFAYGCAALRNWKVKGIDDVIDAIVHEDYYNRNPPTGSGAPGRDMGGDENLGRGHKRNAPGDQADDRATRAKRRSARKDGEGPMDGIMDLVFSLWMYSARRHQQARPVTPNNHGEERVKAWVEAQQSQSSQ